MYPVTKRVIVYLVVASLTFAVGIFIGMRWKGSLDRERLKAQNPATATSKITSEEGELPLTHDLVRRALQGRSFRSDKLIKNSRDEIVWRWLKKSIESYPQNWVRLQIVDGESYVVVLYPMAVLERGQIVHYNDKLKAQGLPVLDSAKQYMEISVQQKNILCPSWTGFIDVETTKLVFFEGLSG